MSAIDRLRDGSDYPCSCGLDALDAAVRKVEGDA